MENQTKTLSKEAIDLINYVCSGILNGWKQECQRMADELNEDNLDFKEFYYCIEDAIDFSTESLWEYEDKVPLNLALEIMSYFADKLEWDFFFTLVNSIGDDILNSKNYYKNGCYLFKQQALILIDGYYLRDFIKKNLSLPVEKKEKLDMSKKLKEIWKGTLDPDKIKKQGDICEPYRKDNRNDLYTRHPYK